MNDPDWLYHVASLSMSCIAEMICIILVYNMPGIPMAFRESTLLSKILSSLSSTLRPTTRQGASAESGTDPKNNNAGEQYNHIEGDGISLNQFRQQTFKHSPSTEQLRDPNPHMTQHTYFSPVHHTDESPRANER